MVSPAWRDLKTVGLTMLAIASITAVVVELAAADPAELTGYYAELELWCDGMNGTLTHSLVVGEYPWHCRLPNGRLVDYK